MKNYRFLVPVLLVVMLLASMYTLISDKVEAQQTYDHYLGAARDYREQGIYIDAQRQYMLALEERPSLELYLELGDLYKEYGMSRLRTKLAKDLLKQYPEDIEVYELAADIYMDKKDYAECFEVMDMAEKRNLRSAHLNNVYDVLEYQFHLATDYDEVGVFGGGMCPVRVKERWGFVNAQGYQSVAARYVKVGPFSSDGVAPVVDAEGNAYYIDYEGYKKRVILNVPNIQELGLMENEVTRLYDGASWGLYSMDGTPIAVDFEAASNIANGVAALKGSDGWRLVGYQGEDLTGERYADVRMDEKETVHRNDRLFVSDGQGWKMIDKTGKVYSKELYEDAKVFADATLAAVKIGGKWGYVNRDGDMKIDPQFEDARSFSNGLAAVKIDGKWGYIDLTGELVLAASFLDAKDMSSSGTAYVQTGDDWELLVLYKYNH